MTDRGRLLGIDYGERRIGLAISDPTGTIASPAGVVTRRAGKRPPVAELVRRAIALEARGDEGFGYDPIFVPVGEERTVAELGNEWKAENSHRARAARDLLRAMPSRGSSGV